MREDFIYYTKEVQGNINGFWTKRFELGKMPHKYRLIQPNEVVFDIDTHFYNLAWKIQDYISANLCNVKINHSVWFTSRSFHIHCFFDELIHYPYEIRLQTRRKIIREYAKKYLVFCDLTRCSENVMIRDFNSEHEITNKKKEIIYETNFKKDNKIPKNIIDNIKYETRLISDVVSFEDKKIDNDFLNYCLNNRFDDGKRNTVLFKNLSIMLNNASMNEKEREKIYKKVVSNCNGKNITELVGWDRWYCKSSKRFNIIEVKKYFDF